MDVYRKNLKGYLNLQKEYCLKNKFWNSGQAKKNYSDKMTLTLEV